MSQRMEQTSTFIPPQSIEIVHRAERENPDSQPFSLARYYHPDHFDNPVPDHHTVEVYSFNFNQENARKLISDIKSKVANLDSIDERLEHLQPQYLQLLSTIADRITADTQWVDRFRSDTIRHEEIHSLQNFKHPDINTLVEDALLLRPHWIDNSKAHLIPTIYSQAEVVIILKEVQAFILQHISDQHPNQRWSDRLWLSAYRIFEFLKNPQEVIEQVTNSTTDKHIELQARYTLIQAILYSGSFDLLQVLTDPSSFDLKLFTAQLTQRLTGLLNDPNSLAIMVTQDHVLLQVDQLLTQAVEGLRAQLAEVYRVDSEEK